MTPFVGYPGSVWATCWQSMAWMNAALASGTSNAYLIEGPAVATFETLLNGLYSLDAWQASVALGVEQQNLAAVQALPLSLDPTTESYLNARVAAVAAAASGLASLPTTADPFYVQNTLSAGSPAIADPGAIEWCMQFVAETPPAGLVPAGLPSSALAAAQAWLTVTQAIGVLQGSSPTAAYDTAARQYRCSVSIASGIVGDVQSGPFAETPASVLWNGAVALPTLLLDAATLASSPSSLQSQQVGVIRNALWTQAQQLALLLLALRNSNVSQPTTATLRNGESLMDLAARTGGDFEAWTAIAAINGLSPPYPGPTNQSVALSGVSLLLSGNGLPPSGATAPTYDANVLGTDWDFGPVNGAQPTWLGDIPLITGLRNFARAIGRRLQTPLGTLIYDVQYGSRIPPEVGAVQSATEASRLLQYGKSAIAADPRTGAILGASGSVQPRFQANFSALVQPIGPGAQAVEVNETIGANP